MPRTEHDALIQQISGLFFLDEIHGQVLRSFQTMYVASGFSFFVVGNASRSKHSRKDGEQRYLMSFSAHSTCPLINISNTVEHTQVMSTPTLPHVTQDHIAHAFQAVGATAGDTLLFHSSLKSMGYVEGGAQTVIDGALQAVGPDGTVAIPTLWYNGHPDQRPKEAFDLATSPAWNGTVAETMRQDPRAIRSNHFSHSVSAIGKRAAELTANHGQGKTFPTPWSDTAFAEISPWTKLLQWNALIAFIGVGMNSCTMKHWIESRMVQETLELLPAEQRLQWRNKLAHDCTPGPWAYYNSRDMAPELDRLGLIAHTTLGNAHVMAIRTRNLVTATQQLLREEPQRWIGEPYLTWREELLKQLNEGTMD